jgi:hypothetical protein
VPVKSEILYSMATRIFLQEAMVIDCIDLIPALFPAL